jgi:hypothetical protein
MSERRAPISKAKLSKRSLLLIGLAIILIVVFTFISRRMQNQAQAKDTIMHTHSANDVVAVINNSGSTNTPASTLTIYKNGSGSLKYENAQNYRFQRYQDKAFPAGTFDSNQLASILTQIQDVGIIPNHNCLKSVSFGSTTTITYQGKTSGDLSCLSEADEKVFLDLKQLVESFYSRR